MLGILMFVMVEATFWQNTIAEYYIQRDVLFILDGHSGVQSDDFLIEKSFITDILSSISSVSECDTKAAVMQYGKSVSVEWNFNSPAASSRAQFEDGMSSVTQIGGPLTSLAAVLNRASKVFNKGGGREDVPKLVVLVISGKSQDNGNLKAAAKKLRKIAKIIVFGVTSEADVKAARQITSDENLFSINDFSAATQIIHNTFKKTTECDTCASEFKTEVFDNQLEQTLFTTFKAFTLKVSTGEETEVDLLRQRSVSVSKKRPFCIEIVNRRKNFYINSVCLETTNIRQVKITGTNRKGKELIKTKQDTASGDCVNFPVSKDNLQLIYRLCFSFLPLKGQGRNMKMTPLNIDTCVQK